MKMEVSMLQLLLLIAYFDFVKLVPDEYCLPPLNISDCGEPPTAVFFYYKPGSRCEIEHWRGCPTQNMFENEYHCSHYCIGKTRYYGRERGSWEGRISMSIDDLPLDELDVLNRIIHRIYDDNDSISDKPKERLINISPGINKLRYIKTTTTKVEKTLTPKPVPNPTRTYQD